MTTTLILTVTVVTVTITITITLRKGFYEILSNPRRTFVTPPGTGFLPRETAQHHQKHIVQLVRHALRDAGVKTSEVNVEMYTTTTLLVE